MPGQEVENVVRGLPGQRFGGDEAGGSQENLGWLVPRQANIRIIQAMAKRLDMPMEKVILTVQDHGNTSAASVPMALDVAIRDGRIKQVQLILM